MPGDSRGKTEISLREMNEAKHFDAMAKNYEKNYGYDDKFTKYKIDKKVNRFANLIKGVLKNKAQISILELGSGTGTYTLKFAKKIPQSSVIASDISKEMINIIKGRVSRKSNITTAVLSAYDTGLPRDSIDVVCGFYVLHHLDVDKVVKEISRILKPGGLVYFYEPNILNPIVYLIKSNGFIKKMVGDTLGEWAINPLTIGQKFKGYKMLELKTTEFVLPVSLVSFDVKVWLDKVSSFVFSKIPALNLLGGSVELFAQKQK